MCFEISAIACKTLGFLYQFNQKFDPYESNKEWSHKLSLFVWNNEFLMCKICTSA